MCPQSCVGLAWNTEYLYAVPSFQESNKLAREEMTWSRAKKERCPLIRSLFTQLTYYLSLISAKKPQIVSFPASHKSQ